MRIDQRLNLVCKVEREGGGVIYVHSMPLSREVFEQYFLVLAKTFAALYAESLHAIAGPRIAMLLLRKIAMTQGEWDGDEGVERGLVNEIRRLTNVVMLGSNGWETLPFHTARERKLLTEDEIAEVEGNICFFICISAMHKQKDLRTFLLPMCGLWGTSISSSTVTEFAVSLATSKVEESTGAEMPVSSVPY